MHGDISTCMCIDIHIYTRTKGAPHFSSWFANYFSKKLLMKQRTCFPSMTRPGKLLLFLCFSDFFFFFFRNAVWHFRTLRKCSRNHTVFVRTLVLKIEVQCNVGLANYWVWLKNHFSSEKWKIMLTFNNYFQDMH